MPFMNTPRRFIAEAVPGAEFFRLKIEVSVRQPEVRQIMSVGDNLDQRQFVGAFVAAFQNFLSTSYPAFLESGGNQFDLRVLPIGKLIDILGDL